MLFSVINFNVRGQPHVTQRIDTEVLMMVRKMSGFAVSTGVALVLFAVSALPVSAAGTDTGASGSTMTKQELKAQKKADSQSRRAKKNAELSTLEKNGYNPAGNQTNYPQNLQNAQQKAAGQKPTNAPAVAP